MYVSNKNLQKYSTTITRNREVSFKKPKWLLPAILFRCCQRNLSGAPFGIWFQSLHVQSLRNGCTKMVHYASHYFNFHPVRLLMKDIGSKKMLVTSSYISAFQSILSSFKIFIFNAITRESFEIFHLLKSSVFKIP